MGKTSKFNILKKLIKDYKPMIICLQETKLREEEFSKSFNRRWQIFYTDLIDRMGGMAIMVKKN